MNKDTSIYEVKASDTALISQISEWYFDEWHIPKEMTIQRLTKHAVDDIIFQLTLKLAQKPIATGGLYKNVGLYWTIQGFKTTVPGLAYFILLEAKGIKELVSIYCKILNQEQMKLAIMKFTFIHLQQKDCIKEWDG